MRHRTARARSGRIPGAPPTLGTVNDSGALSAIQDISQRTVESHVDHIKQKLGLETRTQIIARVLAATSGARDR